jgi:mannose-6-phosphate isomerase-like protein (cupin superfamily)
MAVRPHLVLRADDIMAFQVPQTQQYLSQEILNSENTGLHDGYLNRGTLRPRSALGGSAHPNHDEIYYILSGRGTVSLGGNPRSGEDAETYLIEEGSVVYIPANTFHALRNDSDHDLVLLTVWPQRIGPGDNGLHDGRIREWGTAFRLNDGCEINETPQGMYVTDSTRNWNPLLRAVDPASIAGR